ncbi:Transcription elongation factor, GreA/GreB family [Sphingomonas guangdongensis]|uniref:Transcription elongation factor, GreA/GreB family n=1 Tax=Sphingomonas guangdongensis TaxID=1141890 RepID=A0A285Q9S8_9SPHN|nr:GreA/GreB family elongation factor [Sphingomonas guangdongensis]SOB78695.1 Transcription elongation factor, GreA/GreB family [Sphingomonas guangdongensis]
MSVAFRRESDDEHLEPTFELPIARGPNFVTARGLRLIEARVAELERALAAAADDAERKALRRAHRYWSTRQSTAQLVPAPEGRMVAIGSRVTFCHNGEERVVTIVGGDEADAASERIAFSAPLARALLGAEPGERRDFAGAEDALEVVATEADRRD